MLLFVVHQLYSHHSHRITSYPAALNLVCVKNSCVVSPLFRIEPILGRILHRERRGLARTRRWRLAPRGIHSVDFLHGTHSARSWALTLQFQPRHGAVAGVILADDGTGGRGDRGVLGGERDAVLAVGGVEIERGRGGGDEVVVARDGDVGW